METTLHQQLKRRYADCESNTEVKLGRFRIDAIRGDELIEIQCASLAAIRDKCQALLKQHQLRVVKPITVRTRIAKAKQAGGPVVSRRMSPSRGTVLDLFDELIYFTRVFPHPNLTIEVPMIHVEQRRIPSRRRRRRRWRKNYSVDDVKLESIDASYELRNPADLLGLIPLPARCDGFNTHDLAEVIDRPRWHAQQIAYVLKKTGAIEQTERKRSGIVYRRVA